ncbi:MAG TPA: hypothetical protein VK897_24155 [Anaerolineales bacterium]|nr:hypothetical protein [Anaerolineales bacterium]
MFTRTSILLMSVLLVLTTSCGVPAAAWVAPADVAPTPTNVPPRSNRESVQPSTTTSGDEQAYPYYLPLATKLDIAPQTINSITAVIDWIYVDESRVAFHYTISGLNWPDGVRLDTTSVQISSTMVENIGDGAYGGWSLPVDRGVITGSFDQLLIDGTLKADEHPNIALDVDIPVNGTTAMYPLDPGSGQQPAPQKSLSLPDLGTFHFELTVPVHQGIRFENIEQTVVAHDISITLKTLVLNPSRAEAVICFQMPSVKDWGLTASTINIGGSDYPYSGGTLLPGKDGKEFSLTDTERCGSIGFDIPYDESATSVTLTVPKLVASLSELIDQGHVDTANKRLADQGIEFNYVPVDHGADIEILKQPEGATNMEIYPLILEALADQYEGPWAFEVEIKH